MATSVQKRRDKERLKKLKVIDQPAVRTLSGGDIEIADFVLNAVGKGVPDIDVDESIIQGEINLTCDEGSSQVTITVHDADRDILHSGALWNDDGELIAVDAFLDGLWWRLIAVNKQGDDIVFTFEDRRVTWLRNKKGPRKAASRAKVTRAQYILTLVRSIKRMRRQKVQIPELTKRQPIAKLSEKDRRDASKGKSHDRGGFDKNAKISGVSDAQLKNISIFMEEAERLNADARPTMAGIMAGFGESGWDKTKKDYKTGTHQGVLQADQNYKGPGGPIPPSDVKGQCHHFLVGGRSFRAGGAIQYAKDHQYATLGEIAAKTEISDGSTAYYNGFRAKTKKVYDAWHGGSGGNGSSTSVTLYKRYAFKVNKNEDYWTAIQRMAKEVNWRAFFSGDTFYYLSEERLYAGRALYRIREGKGGVSNVDFQQDYRKKIATATVTCRIDRWGAPPGTVCIVEHGANEKGSQRWLVESIRRNLFSPEAEIALKRPMRARKEPRSDPVQHSEDPTPSSGDDSRTGQVDGLTDGLTADMLQFLGEIAGNTDEKIYINAGKQGHGVYTKDGNVSNHASGNGADMDVGGDSRTSTAAHRKGNNIAIAVMVTCGMSRADAKKALDGPITSFIQNIKWHKYSVEIGWRTTTGGNHYNHVHVGFDNWEFVQRHNPARSGQGPKNSGANP